MRSELKKTATGKARWEIENEERDEWIRAHVSDSKPSGRVGSTFPDTLTPLVIRGRSSFERSELLEAIRMRGSTTAASNGNSLAKRPGGGHHDPDDNL